MDYKISPDNIKKKTDKAVLISFKKYFFWYPISTLESSNYFVPESEMFKRTQELNDKLEIKLECSKVTEKAFASYVTFEISGQEVRELIWLPKTKGQSTDDWKTVTCNKGLFEKAISTKIQEMKGNKRKIEYSYNSTSSK